MEGGKGGWINLWVVNRWMDRRKEGGRDGWMARIDKGRVQFLWTH